jgi:hypothetical protein
MREYCTVAAARDSFNIPFFYPKLLTAGGQYRSLIFCPGIGYHCEDDLDLTIEDAYCWLTLKKHEKAINRGGLE